MTEDTSTMFGKYRLFRRFSGAGMSEVFLAENTEAHGRPVVVKRLPALLAPDSPDADRIRAEARQWAQIGDHPHIVSLFGTCEIDERFCLEMEYVEGRDLGQILRERGTLSPPRAVRIVAQVARALHQAHEGGLLHRDVKPANILVYRPDATDRDQEVHAFLADFGIARREAATQGLTAANQAVGTTAYMAPERFEDPTRIPSDRRVDVYGLACLLYECLTGYRAFGQTEPEMIAWAHRHGARPRPSDVDPGLRAFDAVLRAGLAVDRDERPRDAIEFKEQAWAALERWTAGQGAVTPAPGRARLLAGSPLVLGPAVGAAGAGAAMAGGAGGVSTVVAAVLGLAAGAFGALGLGGPRAARAPSVAVAAPRDQPRPVHGDPTLGGRSWTSGSDVRTPAGSPGLPGA